MRAECPPGRRLAQHPLDALGLWLQVHWIFKNKEHGKMAAAASLGTILLWDVEGGLPQVGKLGEEGAGMQVKGAEGG